jgi:predicted TIM-barrel fold metal-dependent hydrolase
MMGHPDDIRNFMDEPWRSRRFPGPFRYLHPAPTGEPPYGEFLKDARSPDALPASDPIKVGRHLDELGVGRAILIPLTRGLLPDTDVGNAICSATNLWLTETWLGEWNQEKRWLGSIRVNTRDPEAAVKEIERWAGHPSVVQVAVPMEAHSPYGQRHYFRIWEAASAYGLPVAVHADGGAGADFYTSPNGYPRTYLEYHALYPMTFIYHLASLIAEGVFERLPDVRFVFADGGLDLLAPLMLRMDTDWPISRIETPWVTRAPSDYLREHVRFCSARLEGPSDPAIRQEWFEVAGIGELLMFASNYPHWTTNAASHLFPELTPENRQRLLKDNASAFYHLNG